MQKRFTHNLDLFLFGLLNLVFFLSYRRFFLDPSSYYDPSLCRELPDASLIIEYTHLVFFFVFFSSFAFKSCLFTIENEDKTFTKALKGLMNLGLFISFFIFFGMYLYMIYIYNHSSQDCDKLGKLVLIDLVLTITLYGAVLLYRLCFREIIKGTNQDEMYEKDYEISATRLKKDWQNDGRKHYGTMKNREDEEENMK